MLTKTVQKTQRVTKEFESLETTLNGYCSIVVQRKACDHTNIGVHRMSDRYAFVTLDDAVILINPMLSFQRIDKGKGQRPNTKSSGHLDSLPVRAGNPQGGMRFLDGFRHNISTGHTEILAVKAGVRIHRQHVADLFNRLQVLITFGFNGNIKTPQFKNRR